MLRDRCKGAFLIFFWVCHFVTSICIKMLIYLCVPYRTNNFEAYCREDDVFDNNLSKWKTINGLCRGELGR